MPEPAFALTRLAGISARLVTHDWAWADANEDLIARNWERRRAERPGLYDGPVLLACGRTIEDGHCEARFFETRYSRFIAFRDAGSPDPAVANAFAAIVPWTADGAVLLGRMGPHTANAGQIYFPCGTPDRDDIRADGTVDLAGSAARELFEETGLGPCPSASPRPLGEGDRAQRGGAGSAAPSVRFAATSPSGGGEARAPLESADDAPWVLLEGDGQLAFLRPVRFEASAEALIARIAAYHAAQAEPELAGIVVVRSAADIDRARMPPFVQAYLDDAFGI